MYWLRLEVIYNLLNDNQELEADHLFRPRNQEVVTRYGIRYSQCVEEAFLSLEVYSGLAVADCLVLDPIIGRRDCEKNNKENLGSNRGVYSWQVCREVGLTKHEAGDNTSNTSKRNDNRCSHGPLRVRDDIIGRLVFPR